jgi:flagellar hook-basal body complex protein FliE
MAVDSIAPLCRLTPLAPSQQTGGAAPASGSGFAQILNQAFARNAEANAAADRAVVSLATGEAEDLHTVAIAVAQADLGFRTILETRNRLTDAFQEIARMQI